MRRARLWTCAAMLSCAAAAAHAQGVERGGDAAGSAARQAGDSARVNCDSVIAHARVDSESTVVRAFLMRTDGGVMSAGFADLLLQDFAQRFRPPQPLRIPVLAAGPVWLRVLGPEHPTATVVRPLHLSAVVDFRADTDGGASHIRLRLTSLSRSFDSALVATVDAMGRRHLIPVIAARGDSAVPLRLRISSTPDHAGRQRALFRAMLPRLAGADAIEAADDPRPVYPDEERRLGMDGYVMIQVVVARNGRVHPGTAQVLQSTSPAFLRNAVRMLDSLRFTPARVGACPMAQVMTLYFRFPGRLDGADSLTSLTPLLR